MSQLRNASSFRYLLPERVEMVDDVVPALGPWLPRDWHKRQRTRGERRENRRKAAGGRGDLGRPKSSVDLVCLEMAEPPKCRNRRRG